MTCWPPTGGLHGDVRAFGLTHTRACQAVLSIGGVLDRHWPNASSGGTPINRGLVSDGIPDPDAEVGHCVHRIAMHPSRPNVLFM